MENKEKERESEIDRDCLCGHVPPSILILKGNDKRKIIKKKIERGRIEKTGWKIPII